ncbi:MAG: TonB-dependent receptor [Bacteroidales bacterium]|nr:TonB-dependent receptor [Bacteroidales bacterium]
MRIRIYLLSILLLAFYHAKPLTPRVTSFKINGKITCNGQEVPFANVIVKGTTIGTVSNEDGQFSISGAKEGRVVLTISAVGYKPQEVEVTIAADSPSFINLILEEDVMNLEEVVVSADRNSQKRTQAPVIVNTITPKLFNTTQSVVIGEGLNFMPGLRLENDCQNCGFTQVRMNGMEGSYSQILINSRPIFSGLAGVYGLELIPANMIERVEVVRGGGSVLYGSNAIAGTINIILKDPNFNSYEIGLNSAINGIAHSKSDGIAADYSTNFNTSFVTDNNQTGFTIYGFMREREMFDANSDGYSEIAPIENLSLGSRLWQKIGSRGKLSLDLFNIREERNGGNKQSYPLHERDIAEAVKHDMKAGALTYERFFRQYDQLSVFLSGQLLDRDSYYGANKTLKGYGASKDMTYSTGVQYKGLLNKSTFVVGLESTGSHLTDKKLGAPDLLHPTYETDPISGDTINVTFPHTENTLVSDQSLITNGAFAQYELGFSQFKLTAGARVDRYSIKDNSQAGNDKTGNVFIPRVSLLYNATSWLQARISYSQGYRAPQIFDEDLHIETSGTRQVLHKNDPNLKQENSYSYMASVDINRSFGNIHTGLLIEAFYTRLSNPFVNEFGEPDSTGTVVYTRINSNDGAEVKGINFEFKLRTAKKFSLVSGFTVQTSRYDAAQEFNEHKFFRTPNSYGYITLDWDVLPKLCLSASGNYTGEMLAPYFGTNAPTSEGELRETDQFYDFGLKASYTIPLKTNSIQLFAGMKNILNSYQNDFDSGINRDPAYIYGPTSPRTIYFGIKFGNIL